MSMQAVDDISSALDAIRGDLANDAETHHEWCRTTLGLLRDSVDRAVAEGNEPLQEHLGTLVDRVARMREGLQGVGERLARRPLLLAMGCDTVAESGLVEHLAAGLDLPAVGRPGCLVRAEGGDKAQVHLHCWSNEGWPQRLPLSNAVRADRVPEHLQIDDPAAVEWSPLLEQGPVDASWLAHDTRRVLAIGAEVPEGGERCSLATVRARLRQLRLIAPPSQAGVFASADLLLAPARPADAEGVTKAGLLREEAVDRADLLLLPLRIADGPDCGDAAFQRRVWQRWCERCQVDDDGRGLAGRFLIVVTDAAQLFEHTERAPGDWLIDDEQALGARCARRVFNHLLGFHDQGPEAWPPLVFIDGERQPPELEAGGAAAALEAFVERFNEHDDAPIDADDAWSDARRQAWRVVQGLWSHQQFRRNAARRARAFRRCAQALLAFMDPDDRGWGRLEQRIATWSAAGPVRLQRLDGLARDFDRYQQQAIDLAAELRVRDLHDYDLEQIRQAAAFVHETGAYDPLELGFRFADRSSPGLAKLREDILLQNTVRPPDVLQAITQDTVDRLPLPEDMNAERAAEGRQTLLAALRSLIDLDACWRSFRDDYIGPKDLVQPTLVEAAQLVWQRCDAVFEWLIDLGDQQPDENQLQDGERLPVAIDRHLREADVPPLPQTSAEPVDRALQDLMLAANNLATEED